MDNRLYVSKHKNEMQKARRDLSKLTPKVIIDKNGHYKTVYIKLGLPMKKESWDSSDQKVRELTISMFGTTEEVGEMAIMPKAAHNFSEAKEILNELIGKPLTNKGGLVVFISKNAAKEILSGKTVGNSFDRDVHLLAVANVEKLFSNAVEPWDFDFNPEKSNDGLKAIRRLYSPMFYKDRVVVVKLTVKEIKNKNEGNRLYSLKAIDIDLN